MVRLAAKATVATRALRRKDAGKTGEFFCAIVALLFEGRIWRATKARFDFGLLTMSAVIIPHHWTGFKSTS